MRVLNQMSFEQVAQCLTSGDLLVSMTQEDYQNYLNYMATEEVKRDKGLYQHLLATKDEVVREGVLMEEIDFGI